MEYYITPVTSVAQLVERPTEKPGAILTRGRVPSAAKDFSPRVNFLCRLCYVRCPYSPPPPPPPPPIACINICAHVKNPETLAAVFIYHFWTHKNTAHNDRNGGGGGGGGETEQVCVRFTALAAAVSYPDLRCSPLPGSLTALACDSTTISRKGQ